MARHIPRSHVRSHLYPAIYGAACGSPSDKVLPKSRFLKASDRCQKCDRIAQKLPSTSGRKKIEGRFTIVLTGLTDAAATGLEALAADGLAGETIGLLVNKHFEKI